MRFSSLNLLWLVLTLSQEQILISLLDIVVADVWQDFIENICSTNVKNVAQVD